MNVVVRQGYHYVRAFRRRWAVIVAVIVMALGVGWLTAERARPVNRPAVMYSATTVLWDSNPFGDAGGASEPISEIAALARTATFQDVLELAAVRIEFDGDPLDLRSRVQVVRDQDAPILRVTATAEDPREAEATAETVTSELIRYLQQLRANVINRQMENVESQIVMLQEGGAPPEHIVSLETVLSDLFVRKILPLGLTVLQHADAHALPLQGLGDAQSLPARLLIAELIGLFAGLGLALVLERFDSRIRTRQEAEEHFGFPVLAEIPLIERHLRKAIAVAESPTGRAADAFRLLAAGMLADSDRHADPRGNGDGIIDEDDRSAQPHTILVTSAGPADGKTTVAANLAAVFGERGNRVLVLSADLRNPSIHELFDVPLGPGLADVLSDSDERTDIEAFRTSVRGVRLVPSGVMEGDPGELLASARMARLLEAAGRMADVVILDTSPVLVASGVTPLLTNVDAVVLVARANETRREFADRAGDLLRRLRAPVVGLALNCVREISIRSSYGRSYVREARRQRSRKEAEVG